MASTSPQRSAETSVTDNVTQPDADVKKKDADKITDVSLAMASESPQRSEETSVTENISQPTSDVNTKILPTDSERYLE